MIKKDATLVELEITGTPRRKAKTAGMMDHRAESDVVYWTVPAGRLVPARELVRGRPDSSAQADSPPP